LIIKGVIIRLADTNGIEMTEALLYNHKTMHKGGTCDVDNIVGGYQFKYGLPLILLAQIATIYFIS